MPSTRIPSGGATIRPPSGGRSDAQRSADDFLLKLLSRQPSLPPQGKGALLQWSAAVRNAGEPIAAFLTRQGIFIPGASRTLELMQKGYIQFTDCGHLFADGGEARLLAQLLPESPLAEPANDADLSCLDAPSAPRTEDVTRLVGVVSTPGAPSPRPAAALAVGSVLGKCLLTEVLGQGGGGTVFRALHRGLGIAVAVKVLRRDFGAWDGPDYSRLRSEARLLAQLNHPSVVRVLDFEDDPECPYLVMEYVEGLTLADMIHHSGTLSPAQAVRIVRHVAEGLAAAWRLGIVHRDVKPANILLARDGTTKLADLGLAIAVQGGRSAHAAGVCVGSEEAAGTLTYMAPEQFSAGPVDFRADVYALGATLYHALTGGPPLTGATPAELVYKHAQGPPEPPHARRPGLGEDLSALVMRMLAKKPEDRFAGYDKLLAAFGALVLEPTPSFATPPSATRTTPDQASPHTRTRSSIWKSLLGSLARS